MKYRLNKKLRELKAYEPISGEFKVRLDANESFFPLDDSLKTEIKEKINDIDFNRYPDPMCRGVCGKFAEFYGIDAKYVTAGNGSDELISLIVGAFLEDKDKILTFAPDFSMYAFYGSLLGHEIVTVDKGDKMRLDVDEAINAAHTSGAKLVIFSNPCNPTSIGVNKREIIRLITSVDSLVVLDEAYMDFYGETLIKAAGEFDNVILLKTASKAVGMAGIRLGFAVANETITGALRAAKSPYNVNALTQAVGEAVYSRPELLKTHTAAIIESKNKLYKALFEQSGGCFEQLYESDANFVFIKTAFAKKIYERLCERSIAVRYFSGGYLRITAGSEAENEYFLSALKEILGGISDEQRV